ncbi:TlpA disulfide reductase family protein [Pseudomonas sihuiensis]|uniref:Thiol-disulfide isomerase or thioredoxin n=1 Tax=Pseudomonas sihuiensis TaxID=1274359 RepID=A0A1H2LR69_9PSED|nr:TlpA disulfide reductase family protein [Pseudomonas sihuiensis]SDU83510.1 Thiol-disulfide isomerase or thioredoxin [Pseudomonas sihuiensis]
MGLGLRKVGKAVLVICTGLLLTACAEDFGLDQHGRKVTADSLDGQWLIINYWAEWCAPCRTEIPELNALEETLKNQSARVIGVNFDALQGDDLKRAADSFDIRFTVLAQDPAARFELPPTDVLPVTYIVDAEGKLRERLVGEQTSAGLLAHLERLRGE